MGFGSGMISGFMMGNGAATTGAAAGKGASTGGAEKVGTTSSALSTGSGDISRTNPYGSGDITRTNPYGEGAKSADSSAVKAQQDSALKSMTSPSQQSPHESSSWGAPPAFNALFGITMPETQQFKPAQISSIDAPMMQTAPIQRQQMQMPVPQMQAPMQMQVPQQMMPAPVAPMVPLGMEQMSDKRTKQNIKSSNKAVDALLKDIYQTVLANRKK